MKVKPRRIVAGTVRCFLSEYLLLLLGPVYMEVGDPTSVR